MGKSPVWLPVVLAEKCFSQYCHFSHAKSELEMPFPGRISIYTWRVMPITAILARLFFFFFNFTLDLNSSFFHFLNRTHTTILACSFGPVSRVNPAVLWHKCIWAVLWEYDLRWVLLKWMLLELCISWNSPLLCMQNWIQFIGEQEICYEVCYSYVIIFFPRRDPMCFNFE